MTRYLNAALLSLIFLVCMISIALAIVFIINTFGVTGIIILVFILMWVIAFAYFLGES